MSLEVWATVTGLSAVKLKSWVTETVLPTLPVLLDWLRVPKNDGKTGGFTRDDVADPMSADMAFIKQSVKKFINRDQLTATTVWAHTAFIFRGHLRDITACATHFDTLEEWNRGAFDFNEFLSKNMGDTRGVEDGFGGSRDATCIPGKFLSVLQDLDAPLDAPATATTNVGLPV
ncbi:uncharacterized protein ALTATR162_LOCUS11528 [Alternaria atra]|uniref:Uncharacterized protein n=1 Tax=Alternaria atra TaxID=119953 RepID=A0A8J2N5M7_9PLEO|nr:uncharacterized protein ALTATR162_LOCUS11528 [Alternaria atra]CAG5186241.1 unnamed protein product [Alternaria atra]